MEQPSHLAEEDKQGGTRALKEIRSAQTWHAAAMASLLPCGKAERDCTLAKNFFFLLQLFSTVR